MMMKTGELTGEQVAKEMVWLAWQACGGPLGLGVLQNRPDATKDDVWKNATRAGDYSGSRFKRGSAGEVCADYVFGRMMKLYFRYGDNWVEIRDAEPRPDYQAWCSKYASYEELVGAALFECEQVAQ